jgi:hypothetical protein
MDNNKKIVKALLEKNYVDAKESVFKSLYAKASLLIDEERVQIASALFSEATGETETEVEETNEAKTIPDTGVPAGASEDKFKAAAAAAKKAGYKAKLGKGVPAGASKKAGQY